MRNTYTLIGIGALIVIAGAWYAFSRDAATDVIMSNSETRMGSTLSLTSTAFANGASIPSQYTCDAENVSPPLAWSGAPVGTVSLVLIMDDPDIPSVFKEQRGIDSFDHWTLFNIPPEATSIAQATTVGELGANGAGQNAYTGPCPPREYEPSEHRYFFRLFALDAMLDLPPGATKSDVLAAMEGHIIVQAELVGRYKRIAP